MLRKKDSSAFLKAASGQITDRLPIWLMRQAGRYLPEYNKVRSCFPEFLDLCFHPDALTEVTLQPLQRFDLDAAIIFSDILVVPYAMGLDLRFVEGVGPVFSSPVRTEEDVQRLTTEEMKVRLESVYQGIRVCQKALGQTVPLIGFSGSPFTLACYAIEGKSSADFIETKKIMYGRSSLFFDLLHIMTRAVIAHLLAQIEAGVDAVMIFDSWGGVLSAEGYERFSLAFVREVIGHVKKNAPQVPLVFFTKGGGGWLNRIAASSCDVLGLDWMADLSQAKETAKHFSCALQGNLDPLCLLGSRSVIADEVKHIVTTLHRNVPYIFNLGHGVHRLTPVDNVSFLIETIRKLTC